MVLESKCRGDSPFVHDLFYRVIKPKAKSTVFELSLSPSSTFSLFRSKEKRVETIETRDDLRYTFQTAFKSHSLG